MYYVYVIWNEEAKKYYIGQTNNLEKRISQHNNSNSAYSKYTKQYKGLWALVYFEEYLTRKEAKKREKYLKNRSGREFIKNKILSNLTITR
ncbi:GIY-YIG nuclease family protein [bacterium]|nr:GIY-YIG nuclease family protein [bacterium]MCG2676510.1 GIY-YIG nuclease family protein [bacterium]MCG2678003.1 GIY-YIG nuclease family protein [bacterium]